MNRKAQGVETIKTLILILVIAGVILLLVFAIIGNLNKTRKSNFCLLSINLAAEKNDADKLNCDRSSEVIKKSDFSDPMTLKKMISTTITSCSAAVGRGVMNPFAIQKGYEQFSDCLVCSDLSFESNETIKGIPYWTATNMIPGSSSETYYQRITGKAPSQKAIEQLQNLPDAGTIDSSKKYSVFWKVDIKDYWDTLAKQHSEGKVKLVKNDGSSAEYVILGDNTEEYFIAGEDFFGFVTNVDNDKKFVSSVWIGTDDFILSNFNQYGDCGAGVVKCGTAAQGDICHYVHN